MGLQKAGHNWATFTFHPQPWKIPGTEESRRLQSIELQRVGHDWATKPPPPPPFTRDSYGLCLKRSSLFTVFTSLVTFVAYLPSFSFSLISGVNSSGRTCVCVCVCVCVCADMHRLSSKKEETWTTPVRTGTPSPVLLDPTPGCLKSHSIARILATK